MEHTESTSPPRRPDGRIAGLDGLRAISILLVLVGHGAATLPVAERFRFLEPYLGNGDLGVMTFFVISGYLITYLLRKEWERSGTIGLRGFYTRRMLRIFPAFYAFLATVVILRAVGWIETTYPDIALAATFLTNYKHCFPIPTNEDYRFIGHFWTLSLEEQFYLFWPATILLVGLFRAPRVACLIVLLAPVLRVVTYFTWPSARGSTGMMLHTAADPLMIGCLAALWQGRPSLEALLSKLSAWYWPMLATLFLLIASPWLSERFRGAYNITVGLSLNGLVVAFLLLWVVRHPGSLLVRGLSTPVLRHIGVLSYSLYLWQQLFLRTKNPGWTEEFPGWAGVFPFNFVACFVAAELSYSLVESPVLRLRDRFLRQRRLPVVGNSAAPRINVKPAAVNSN